MRTLLLAFGIVAGLLVIPATHSGSLSSVGLAFGAAASSAHALEGVQAPQINVEINKPSGGGRAWYANPLWIAIGVLGVLVVVVLIVMAAKGGGTTVVRG